MLDTPKAYLIIFCDRSMRQTSENLTATDYLAAAQGLSSIVRCRESGFERLVFDENRPFWVPVKNAGVLACQGAVLNC